MTKTYTISDVDWLQLMELADKGDYLSVIKLLQSLTPNTQESVVEVEVRGGRAWLHAELFSNLGDGIHKLYEHPARREPMQAVADRFAHSLALELECVLADRPRYYDKAMQVLGEYRMAMNAIHEQHSPTFMGEPVLGGIEP